MKLPWYIKDNGTEFIGGSIFVNLKVKSIYIIWLKVKMIFTMLFGAIKQFLNSIGAVRLLILLVIAFFVFMAMVYEVCHWIAFVLEKIFG